MIGSADLLKAGLAASLFLISAAASLQAQNTWVQGRVVDRVGQPVAGARVALHAHRDLYRDWMARLGGEPDPPAEAAVFSDENGLYRFHVPQNAMWSLSVSLSGFYPMELPARVFTPGYSIPDAVLLGCRYQSSQVVSAKQPAVGVVIEVLGPRGRQYPSQWRSAPWRPFHLRVLSDGQGIITYPVLPGTPNTFSAAPAGVDFVMPTILTPGSQPVLVLVEGQPLPLQVVDELGHPLRDVLVYRRGLPRGITDENGSVTLYFSPNADRSFLRFLGPDGAGYYGYVDWRDPPEVIRLERPRTINVTVVDEASSAPLANAAIWLPEQNEVCFSNRAGSCRFRAWPISRGVGADLLGYQMSISYDRKRLVDQPVLQRALRPASLAQGWVSDHRGNPVDGARVRARPARYATSMIWHQTFRGAQNYSLQDGSFLIEVNFDDPYLQVRADYPRMAPDTERTDGQPVHLQLVEGGLVSGRVIDPEGRPVSNAVVSVHAFSSGGRPTGYMGAGAPIADVQTRSEADGSFLLEGVPSEQVVVSAFSSQPEFSPALSPNLSVREPGQHVDAGDLQLGYARKVTGRIINSQDEAIPEASISLRPKWSISGIEWHGSSADVLEHSDQDGRFQIYVPPDQRMEIRVSSRDYESKGVDVPEDTSQPLEIVLLRTGVISGQVVDAAGRPLAGVNLRLKYRQSEQQEDFNATFHLPDTDQEGRFKATNQRAGDYRLEATPEGDGPHRSEIFTLEEGEEEEIRLVVREKPVRVSGLVLDASGRPVDGAKVYIGPDLNSLRRRPISTPYASLQTEKGRFQTGFDEPGEYDLSATADGVGGQKLTIDLQEGHRQIEVTLDPTQMVVIRVLDPEGKEAVGASITIRQGQDTSNSLTDRGVTYHLVQNPGLLAVAARLDDLWASGEIMAGHRPLPELTLRLQPGVPVEGRVEGLDEEQLRRLDIFVMSKAFRTSIRASATASGEIMSPPLPVGRFQVHATVSDSALRLEESITVREGQDKVRIDLRFPLGLTADLQVLGNGQPLSAAYRLWGGTASFANGQTRPRGRIYLEGLSEGSYQLLLMGSFGTTIQQLEMPRDLNRVFDLSLIDVSGQILNEAGEPVEGASVRIGQKFTSGSASSDQPPALTDSEGTFALKGVMAADGGLRIDHPDYALTSVQLPEEEGKVIEGLEIVLPEAGTAHVILTGKLPGDRPPHVLRMEAGSMAGDSKAEWSGDVLTLKQMGPEDTHIRLMTNDMRSVDLTIRAGQTREVSFEPAARVEVEASTQGGSKPLYLRLWDSQGKPFMVRDFAPMASAPTGGPFEGWWPIYNGKAFLPALKPGLWRLQVVFENGTTSEQQVQLIEGEERHVRFP
ncbi:MAG TPA: carboxypeptidase regulatory-like domain-containing protein [Acidobacteriota bacterium]|nr:carboxypeptidase regulatory-like domain-containing protein [Acidobacteriota bacterium]